MIRGLLPFVLAGPLAFAGHAQTVAGTGRTDAQGLKQGTWTKTWANGRIRYEGSFKDDTPVGEFRHFDDQGRLVTIQRHAGDGKVSRAEHFHPNGKTMATGKYLGRSKDSTWSYYDTEGRIRKVERYANGVFHGTQEAYYANGGSAEVEEFVGGERHGVSRSWFDNGQPKTEATYVNGEPEGRMTFYFPSGKKEIEGNLVNGDRDGTWYYFNPDGTLQLQVLYRKGVMVKERKENGVFREYYDDERPVSEVRYKQGKREGPFVEYHDNGEWVVRTMPADPVMGTPADMERVLQGQTKKREGTYRNDLLEGEVKEYDTKGRLIKVTRYTAGEPVAGP